MRSRTMRKVRWFAKRAQRQPAINCGCVFGKAVWIVASKGRTSNETQSHRYQYGFAPAQKAGQTRQDSADCPRAPAADRRGLRNRWIFLVAELPKWSGLRTCGDG